MTKANVLYTLALFQACSSTTPRVCAKAERANNSEPLPLARRFLTKQGQVEDEVGRKTTCSGLDKTYIRASLTAATDEKVMVHSRYASKVT